MKIEGRIILFNLLAICSKHVIRKSEGLLGVHAKLLLHGLEVIFFEGRAMNRCCALLGGAAKGLLH